MAPLSPEAAARAARRVERWRREAELQDDALFAARLAADGLTPDRLAHVLAEPAAGLARRLGGPPTWLAPLVRAYTAAAAADPLDLPITCDPASSGAVVLALFGPLVADAHRRLLAGLRGLAAGGGGAAGAAGAGLLAVERVAATLLPALLRRLERAAERTLALELQASRIEGRLAGATAEERFAAFVAELRRPAAGLAILLRYPVLARDACTYAVQWEESGLELADRWVADHAAVRQQLLGGRAPGALVGVEAGRSDPHEGGRTVAVLTYESGARVVYKPKPLGADVLFAALVSWLAARGAAPPLRAPAVVDRGTHGWVEHIATAPCVSLAEVERFFARQGAWVALLYAMEATDFHHENVIAAGEHPVPIDLETLIQPTHAVAAAYGLAYQPAAHTVLQSGLLPRRFWATAAEGGLDMSAMGAGAVQRTEVRRMQGAGTDAMHWGRGEALVGDGANLPTCNGSPVEVWTQLAAVVRGFRATYELLLRHRDELLAPGGPLARFAGVVVRVLLRSTTSYAHLLHVAHHPDYLQSAIERDRLYDRLWLDAVAYAPLRATVAAEREDLLAGDVPRWSARTGETDLRHPRRGAISGYFAVAGLDAVRARLAGLGADDLERQTWLVQAALEATRSLGDGWTGAAAAPGHLPPAAAAAEPGRFVEQARRLGERIARLAVRHGEMVTWFHLEPRPDGYVLGPMPIGLYQGLSGVALFLAHLGRLGGGARYEELARVALGTIRRHLAEDPGSAVHAGAFDGWGGIVYTLAHLGALWGEPALTEEAAELALRRVGEVERDEHFDVIAGASGALAALLALHAQRPGPALLAAAVRCGERLLQTAVRGPGDDRDDRRHRDDRNDRSQRDDRGQRDDRDDLSLAWPCAAEAGHPALTGFGHGAAGIGWSLARLGAAAADERFVAAARGALRYERGWFCAARGNWPDLRPSRRDAAGEPDFLHAWCHGAPGIGLGRLGMLDCLEDAQLVPEVRIAVRTTLAEGFGGNQSLCHGDLGNLELVRLAARRLGDPEYAAEAGRLAARILARIEAGGLRGGAAPRTENLGLMVGLAGIGYGLLRAAHPERVPAVLLLEMPAGAG